MTNNLIEAQYDITKKSKLKKFYESNKILIYLFIFILIILFGYFSYYLDSKEKKEILLSENYVEAKIYLENENKVEALNLLKNAIFANDATYSTLSFFMILDQNLIKDYDEVTSLFDHLLANNKFDREIRNLLVYKKALLSSNYVNESELLAELKPLLNKETLWRPHALLLLGDYFVSKEEYVKAKEFYIEIFSINNLQRDLYDQAKSQLAFFGNDY